MCQKGGPSAPIRSKVLSKGESKPHLRQTRAFPTLHRQTQSPHGLRVWDLLYGMDLDLLHFFSLLFKFNKHFKISFFTF